MSEPRGFGRMKPQATRARAPMPHELCDMLDWPKNGDPVVVRVVGDVVGYGIHKIKVLKKDGSETTINKPCLAYDPETDSVDSTKPCPYCKMPSGQGEIQYNSHLYFANVIVRELQEQAPRKLPNLTAKEQKTGIKDADSSSWTPVRVMRIPSTLAQRLKKLGERNIVVHPTSKAKKAFDVNHPKYGIDLEVSFDKNATPANMYSADKTESPSGKKYSPLSEEEQAYLLYDLNALYTNEEMAEAKKEAKSLNDRWYGAEDGDDEDDRPSRKGKPAAKSRKPSRDEDDDADDDFEDDEDFELDKPKRGAKPAAKSRKPSRDEDEDDFDDDDLDDEDFELDKPTRGKKPAAKSRKPSRDEADEDFEDEDDDEEEARPSRSKKPAPKAKPSRKPSRDEDEDFDDDDLDDLDEDDDELSARSSKSKAKPAAKSRKPSRDEDDDFDDDIPF